MANFCKDCGAKLEEGSNCNCKRTEEMNQQEVQQQEVQQPMQQQEVQQPMQQQEVQQQSMQQQPMQQQPMQQQPMQQQPMQQQAQQPAQQSELVEQAKVIASSSWKIAKEIIVAPETGISTCMRESNRKLLFSLIGVQAVLSGLFALLTTSKIETMIGSQLGVFGGLAPEIFSDGRTFFVTIICSLLNNAILFGLLYGTNTIFKLELTTDNLLAAVSVKSVGASLVVALAVIVSFLIHPAIGTVLFGMGGILGLLFLESAIRPTLKVKNVRTPYILLGILVLFIILSGYVMMKGYPHYVSDAIQSMTNDPVTYILNNIF